MKPFYHRERKRSLHLLSSLEIYSAALPPVQAPPPPGVLGVLETMLTTQDFDTLYWTRFRTFTKHVNPKTKNWKGSQTGGGLKLINSPLASYF
jgi:hypothetical protein